MKENVDAFATPTSDTLRHRQEGTRRLALTLADIADNPARLAEATADEVASLYGAIEAMRARLIARLPNAGALQPASQQVTPEYLTLKDLAGYCAIGTRRLRDHLTDPGHPLPHFRVGGKILVRRSDFESWIIAYRRIGSPDVERVVREVVAAVVP
jgi:Helix-turn-helix domain